jgi:hypothetical protein
MNFTKIISIFLFLFLTILATKTHAANLKNKNISDIKKIEMTFLNLMSLKQQEWNKIKFVSVENHIKKSQMFKVVLKDQIGRKWLFKDAPNHGAISVYRAYTILGAYTPEIFEVTLNIGGQEIRGSVQEFISDVKNFSGSYAELGDYSVNYMLDSHLLSYITLNYHVHTGQFLASSSKGLVRIDNSVNYTLIDENWSAELSYISPTLAHISNSGSSGYVNFWKYIITNGEQIKKLAPPLRIDSEAKIIKPNYVKTLSRAKIISLLSDEVFSSFFSECVKEIFRFCSNNYDFSDIKGDPFGFVTFRSKDFKRKILARKASSYPKLKNIYNKISEASSGEKLKDVTQQEVSTTAAEIIQGMEKQIEMTAENIKKLESVKDINQMPVEAYHFSYPLFLLAQSLSKVGFLNSNERVIEFIKIKKEQLVQLKVSSSSEEAKSYFLANLDEIIARVENNKIDKIGLWSILFHSSMLLEKDYIKKVWSYSTFGKHFNPSLE